VIIELAGDLLVTAIYLGTRAAADTRYGARSATTQPATGPA
jgi:hypothetical protein